MAVTGDILRMTTFYRWGTIEARMVAFFVFTQVEAIVPTEAAIAEWYHVTNNAAMWQFVGASAAQFYRTVVDNLSGGLLFGDYEEAFNGGKGDTPMPSFNALSVKQVVGSRETRAGYKRIPFITEDINIGGVADLTTEERDEIEAWYGDTFMVQDQVTSDNIGLIAPVIIGRVNVGTPEAPEYELDLEVQNLVIDAIVQEKITSQISRKK